MRHFLNKLGFLAIASMCVATATFLIAVAHGQDSKLKPLAETTLKAGFSPDPFTAKVQPGGELERTVSGVKYYISPRADFRLNYTAGKYPLYIKVECAKDTVIYVVGPDGKYSANDDYRQGSFNPGVEFTANNAPKSGAYDIWVGTKIKGEIAAAKLIITEIQ